MLDYSVNIIISYEFFISIDRVKENAQIFKVDFEEELLRVMAHGILHFCGYKDEKPEQMKEMREKENEKIKMRSEEHTSELQSRGHLVCRLLLEKKKDKKRKT